MTATLSETPVAEHMLILGFDLDGPDPDAALTWVLENVTAGTPGHIDTWVEASQESEDDTIDGDQHHDIRATFRVPGAHSSTAAQALLTQLRSKDKNAPARLEPTWLMQDGDWIFLPDRP
jgi:hypothetical protein